MTINAADWATVNRLLEQALELPPNRRDAWLDTLPDEHAQLRPTLQQLLTRADAPETTDFLRTLPKLDRGAESATADRAESEQVGPYRLIRPLGQGGMGIVWLAERIDGSLKRQVALKLPLIGGAPAMRERLARERDLLAALEHPNIARLYDAGVDTTGQPYLALEYVEGQPIDAYCRARGLDTRARLAVFLQVARAVAYAHANLTLHRDLKPANILVTADGQVRLLDFGVAKLLEDGGTRETELTQLAGHAMTPDYASPEQILGQQLTVASDVYGLGVVLYELLTGVRPYKLKRDSRGALEDAIVTAEPQPPSAAVHDRALRRQLAGDLDTIVLKALKKAPSERYATANALIEDIERHRAGRAVQAQADTVWYRTRKFVARNRLGVAFGVLATIAVLAGVISTLVQAQRAERARDAAVRELAFSSGSYQLLRMLLGASSEQPMRASDLLQRAEQAARTQFTSDAPTRARMLMMIGFQYADNRDHARALAAFSAALDAARQAGREDVMANIECGQAGVLGETDRRDEARTLFARGIERMRNSATPDLEVLGSCLQGRADLHATAAEPKAQLDDAEAAVAVYRQAGPAGSGLRRAMESLAGAYSRNERLPEALNAYGELVAEAERNGTLNGGDGAITLSNLSTALYRAGQMRRAADVYSRAEAVARGLGEGNGLLPIVLGYRARALADMGYQQEAERLGEEALTLARGKPTDLWTGLIAAEAASAWCVKPDAARCGQLLDEAASVLGAKLPPRHPIFGSLALQRARLAYAVGNLAGAQDAAASAGELFSQASQWNPEYIRSIALLASAETLHGDVSRALDHSEEALAMAQRMLHDLSGSQWTGEAWLARALALRATHGEGAESAGRQALDQLRQAWGEDAPAFVAARKILNGH